MALDTVIVTGGAGYIGSHTLIELMERTPYRVVSMDNHANSNPRAYERVEANTGRKVTSVRVDLCDREATLRAIASIEDVIGVIHFAAFKSVPESVSDPGLYYRNNIGSLLNVLEGCDERLDLDDDRGNGRAQYGADAQRSDSTGGYAPAGLGSRFHPTQRRDGHYRHNLGEARWTTHTRATGTHFVQVR